MGNLGLQYRAGSFRGPIPPPYCFYCGRKTVVYKEKRGFDPATGEAIFVNMVRCSKIITLWGGHLIAEQDANGDWAYYD